MGRRLHKYSSPKKYTDPSCPYVGVCRKGQTVTSIEVFDTEAKRIEKLAKKYRCCDASVVEVLFDILEENDIDIEEAWEKGA